MLSFQLFSQTVVETAPQFRKVVLEQYTGVNSPFDPAGHRLVNTFAANHLNNVSIINIHTGGYSPMYHTVWNDMLAQNAGFSYYPSASVNRSSPFGGFQTAMMDTLDWIDRMNYILQQPAFVNIGATAQIDMETKQINIHTEIFYTNNADPGTNVLNIALVQDNILGYQKGMQNNPAQITNDGKYKHLHVLRDLMIIPYEVIDQMTGDTLNPIPMGTYKEIDTVYNLPDSMGVSGDKLLAEIGDISLVVFITLENQTIYTGVTVKPTYINLPDSVVLVTRNERLEYVLGCNNLMKPIIEIKNESDTTVRSMLISYNHKTVAGSLFWLGSLGKFEKTTIEFDPIEVEFGQQETFYIFVDSVNGFGKDEGAYLYGSATNKRDSVITGRGKPSLLLKCDRNGGEITWKLYNHNMEVIQSGGPYSNLASPPSKPDTILLRNITSPGCYIFEIIDAYGDGINNNYGAGFYKIVDMDKLPLVESQGKFGFGESKDFSIGTIVGLENVSGSIYQTLLYPNPAKNKTTLDISVSSATLSQITVTNILGKEVINISQQQLNTGKNLIDINTSELQNGLYFVNIITEAGISTKKLVIKR
jgi:hypothetical protein